MGMCVSSGRCSGVGGGSAVVGWSVGVGGGRGSGDGGVRLRRGGGRTRGSSGGLRATRLVFFVRAFLLGDKAVMRVRNVVNQGIVFEYLFSLFLRATLSSLLVD